MNKVQLILKLHDGAIKFATNAKEDINSEESQENLKRTENIIYELFCSLDTTSIEQENFVKNLHQLYRYCYQRITDARYNKDVSKIDDVLVIMKSLRDNWKQVV